MTFSSYKIAIKAIVLFIAVTGVLYAMSSGPPAGFTGGFDEPTCIICHSTYPLDSGRELGGDFFISDLPDVYVPGEVYTLTVVITHPDQRRWGFELSARDESGAQAGSFELTDPENTSINDYGGVAYVHQTSDGTMEGVVTGPVTWSFDWTAPEESVGPVYFHATGVAADDNYTADNDYIYSLEQIVPTETMP